MVLICLIFSVLSTIEQYRGFADETLFWMVRLGNMLSVSVSVYFVCPRPVARSFAPGGGPP